MAGARPDTRSASETDPRCLRSPVPQIVKKQRGDMLDTSLGLGDTAVNISGEVCLQGTFVEMGKGEHIIN